MNKLMKDSKGRYKKMRFLNCEKFELKEYIKFGNGHDAIQALKTRLNMQEIYGNYKGNYELPRICPHCEEEDDTTEHLITCPVFVPTNIDVDDLQDDGNVELWRQINELVAVNMKWRIM